MDRNKMKRKIAMMLCVCVLFASSAPLALAEAEATPSETQVAATMQMEEPTMGDTADTSDTAGGGTGDVTDTGESAPVPAKIEATASVNGQSILVTITNADESKTMNIALVNADGKTTTGTIENRQAAFTELAAGVYSVIVSYDGTNDGQCVIKELKVETQSIAQAITATATAGVKRIDVDVTAASTMSVVVTLMQNNQPKGTRSIEAGVGKVSFENLAAGTYSVSVNYASAQTGVAATEIDNLNVTEENVKIAIGGVTPGENKLTVSGTAKPNERITISTVPDGGSVIVTAGADGKFSAELVRTAGTYTEVSAQYVSDAASLVTLKGTFVVTGTGDGTGTGTGGGATGGGTTGGTSTVTPITPETPTTPTEEDKQFNVVLRDGNLKLDVEITGGSNREVAVTLTHEDGTVTEKKETLFGGAANVSFSGLKAGVYAVKVAYTGTSNTTPFGGSVTIFDENALPKPTENTYRKIVANASVNGQKISVQVTDSGYNIYDAASGEMKVQPKTLVVTLIGGPSTKTIKTDTAFAEFTDLPAGQYTVTVAYDDHADAALESTINGLTVAQNTQAITATATAGVKRIDVDVTAASTMSVVVTLMQNNQPKGTRSIEAGVGKVSFENLAAGTYSVSVNYASAQTGVAATEIDNLNVTEENVKIAIGGVTPGENKLTVSGTAKPNERITISTVPDGGSVIVTAGADGKFTAELARTAGTYTAVSAQYVGDEASRVTLQGTFVVTGTVTKPGLEVDDLYNNSLTVVAKTTAGVTVYLKTGDYEQTLVADNRGIVRFTLPHTYAQGTRFTLTVYYGAGNSMSYNVEATVGGTPYYKLFKRGSRGDGVYALTSRLSEMGYPVSPTNYYSDSVAAAVRLFQSANGLSADGMAGKLTQEKLYSVSAIGYSESGQTYPTLVRGDRGMALLYTLQQRLKDLGYYTIRVDGIFGSGTQRAVRWFQSVNGLSVTGKADNATQQLLYSAQAKAASGYSPESYDTLSRSNRYKAAVVPLQRRLKALGYLSGSADGYFGSNTYRAVRNFQSRNGLSVTGVADSGTQQLLYSSSARPASGSSSSGSGSSTGYRLLYWGCRGDAVKRLQQALIDAGYKSYVRSADGIYGQWTYDAVRAYQKDVGLSVDGIAGKNTQNKLYGTKY